MKLALVYTPKDTKLVNISYSQAYKDQWYALITRFNKVQHINSNCSARDIEADVIIFYDPHSAHDIKIDGIKEHRALKYTYMDDPHQPNVKGHHKKTNQIIHKLGPKGRIERAIERGIDYIICPYTESYYRHFGDFLDGMAEKMLVWFPVSSNPDRYISTPLEQRKHEVLANGALNHLPNFKGYEFRKWAFRQPEVTFVRHCKDDPSVPRGLNYPKLLARYAGALALCDTHTPPKYTEIPLAGCVCFAQYQQDCERMGFRNGENCVYVDKENFSDRINEFRSNVSLYQDMAIAGRKLVLDNWTSRRFADYIYNHAKERINGCRQTNNIQPRPFEAWRGQACYDYR